MNKFERVGFETGDIYDRGYSEEGHPKSELVIYQFSNSLSLNGLRDSNQEIPYFLRLHKALPLETNFSQVNSFDPNLKPVNVVRARNIEDMLFPKNDVEVYLADTTKRGGTGSLKDPDAIVMLYRLKELGYDSFALASTGDCGASVCHIGSKLGMKIHLFIPDDCLERWDILYQEMSAKGLVNQNYVNIHNEGRTMHDAFEAAVDFAHKEKMPHDYFFNNQLRIEGSKTIHIEVMEALEGSPDYYVQALGSGTGLFAMWKAAHDLGQPIPKLVGVQPSGCAPMVRAANGQDEQAYADTHVMGIGLPKIGPAFPYLSQLGAQFVGVHEGGKNAETEKIKSDIEILKEAGIQDPGLEASLTVSGLEKIADEIKSRSLNNKRSLSLVLGITGKMRDGDRRELYQ
jgi:threonine dehydratase